MACRPRGACVHLDRGRPLICYNKALKDMDLGRNVGLSASWTGVPGVTQPGDYGSRRWWGGVRGTASGGVSRDGRV